MRSGFNDSQRLYKKCAFETGREEGYWNHPITRHVLTLQLRRKLELALEAGEKVPGKRGVHISLQGGEILSIYDEGNGYFMLQCGESSDHFDPDGIREDEPEAMWGSNLTLALVNLLIEKGTDVVPSASPDET